MKFMVEFRLFPGGKEKALEFFELRGPNRHAGVTFRGAWVGGEVVFVLAESQEHAAVEAVAAAWQKFGSYAIHPVVDIEQY